MYESLTVVGERGQITIPKDIRDKEGLKPKDRVILKIEDDQIIIEKVLGREEGERLMAEGYKKMAKLSLELEEEMKYASQEADATISDYSAR